MNLYPISAAVLAGGENSRIATEKALLPIKDTILIENTLQILDECFKEVLIISAKDTIRKIFPERKIFADIYQTMGALAGIHAAISYAANEAVFVFACDMPELSKKLIGEMAEYYLQNCRKKILIATHPEGYEPLHSIYCKNSIEIAERRLNAQQLKVSDFFHNALTEYYHIPASLIYTFQNINTKDDYIKWKRSNKEQESRIMQL